MIKALSGLQENGTTQEKQVKKLQKKRCAACFETFLFCSTNDLGQGGLRQNHALQRKLEMGKAKLIFLISLLAGASGAVQAAHYAHGRSHSVSIAEAKKLPDNAGVVLEGKIVGRAGHDDDKYWFVDSTGRIRVDVDDDDLYLNQRVQLFGEVDRNDGRIEIDADHLRPVN